MEIWWADFSPYLYAMKNIISLVPKIFVLLLIVLWSCASITEEIYLNADGSGEYKIYSDVISSSRTMMMSMMSSLYPNASEDSLRQVVDAQLWEQFPAEIDSIIDISSRVPDSIKNDPNNRKYLDKMKMYMRGSRKEGFLNSGMRYEFESVKELQEFQGFLNDNQTAADQGMQMDIPKVKVEYSFDGNSFSRRSVMTQVMEMSDSTKMIIGSILDGSKSKLIIHLPSKVKKASKDQLVEKSKKYVIYEYDLLSVLEGEQSTDVIIEF